MHACKFLHPSLLLYLFDSIGHTPLIDYNYRQAGLQLLRLTQSQDETVTPLRLYLSPNYKHDFYRMWTIGIILNESGYIESGVFLCMVAPDANVSLAWNRPASSQRCNVQPRSDLWESEFLLRTQWGSWGWYFRNIIKIHRHLFVNDDRVESLYVSRPKRDGMSTNSKIGWFLPNVPGVYTVVEHDKHTVAVPICNVFSIISANHISIWRTFLRVHNHCDKCVSQDLILTQRYLRS